MNDDQQPDTLSGPQCNIDTMKGSTDATVSRPNAPWMSSLPFPPNTQPLQTGVDAFPFQQQQQQHNLPLHPPPHPPQPTYHFGTGQTMQFAPGYSVNPGQAGPPQYNVNMSGILPPPPVPMYSQYPPGYVPQFQSQLPPLPIEQMHPQSMAHGRSLQQQATRPNFTTVMSPDSMTVDQHRAQLEASLPGARQTSCWIGNLADGITDELVNSLLSACGGLKKWRRVQDVGGTPKSFGFAEYISADGLLRCIRLLVGITFLSKPVGIKIDEATKAYLSRYLLLLAEHDQATPDKKLLDVKMDDLNTAESILNILSQRKLLSAMEFMEKRINHFTKLDDKYAFDEFKTFIEPTKKDEATGASKSAQKPEAHKSSTPTISSNHEDESPSHNHSSLDGRKKETWETVAYRERLKRWESQEAQKERRKASNKQREAERKDAKRNELDELVRLLKEYDDKSHLLAYLAGEEVRSSSFPTTVPRDLALFYTDRKQWRDRMAREWRHEEEATKRDQQREKEITEKIELAGQKRQETIKEQLRAKEIAEYADLVLKRQNSNKSSSSSSVLELKARKKRPLLPIDYTMDDLLQAGYSQEQAESKLKSIRREKIETLIKRIPHERESLFTWQVDWEFLDYPKLANFICKKLATELPQMMLDNLAIAKRLTRFIGETGDPEELLGEIGNAIPKLRRPEEVEMWAMRIWRWVVYETEAQAYGIS